MSQPILDEQEIFQTARKIRAAESRAAYLRQACGGSAALKARVEMLLAAWEEDTSFLEAPPAGLVVSPTLDLPSPEKPGAIIGCYKLLQVIGEGGMGIVYMAEQQEPVERRVALKVIKPGMDSRQVVARFEAERQALAMMNHQNIAQVYEAGTTESGRPYFVMELVKGVPISRYCDEKHLSLKERLKLMIPVCHAIQHAHQKGIIHRDIKPTNVLVAPYDGCPVPKVIDFGVAKAIAQKLTERTMFTELGQVVGTLEYMSPEQAELNQLDIDTRSDIYSLGVLLYELLTGSTPFDKQKLRTAAFHEMLRIIREEEPPRPSIRLSTVNTLPAIAANRQAEPARLRQAVRGELDWIVMKALEKDRVRRYETASAFAADIQRYLSDEPVQACPPTAGYRFQKFARKNKAAMTTAALVLVALLLGIIASTGQAIRATRAEIQAKANEARARDEEQKAKTAKDRETAQRRRAEQQAQSLVSQRQLLLQNNRINSMLTDELLTVLRELPISDSKRHSFFVTSLKRLGKLDPKERVAAYQSAGGMFAGMNEYTAAISAYTEGLAINPRHTPTYVSRGDVYFQQQEFEKAVADYTSAIENRSDRDPAGNQLPWARRGFALCRLKKLDEAAIDFRRSYEYRPQETLQLLAHGFQGKGVITASLEESLHEGVVHLFDRFAEERGQSAADRMFCIDSLAALGLWDAARKQVAAAAAAKPNDFALSYCLALLALKSDDVSGYRRICTDILARQAAAKSWENAFIAAYTCSVAPAALSDYSKAIAVARRALTQQPNSARARMGLGAILLRAGQHEEALVHLLSAIDCPSDAQQTPYHAPYLLAITCHHLGRTDEAAQWLQRGAERAKQFASDSSLTWRSQIGLELLREEATRHIGQPSFNQGLQPSGLAPDLGGRS